MTFWAVRAGKHGENEAHALDNSIVSIGWEDVGDLSDIRDRDKLHALVNDVYKDEKPTTTRIWTGEIWALRERMQVGDLVGIPLKTRSAVAIGRISGEYRFDPDAPHDAKHQRPVKWLRTDLPRIDLDQDILFSLGSTLTVFRVKRDNAEERVLAAIEGRKPRATTAGAEADQEPEADEPPSDLEQFARDKIIAFLGHKFRGHELARLVEGVLTAEGYRVFLSPPGADGGIDLIAGAGPMGFDPPRLAVQVKSSDSPADVGVLRELQGVMPRFGAGHGLIVAWGGFKDSVIREARQLYFQVRLWDSGDLLEALLASYDKLPEQLQAELPLKRIWTLASE